MITRLTVTNNPGISGLSPPTVLFSLRLQGLGAGGSGSAPFIHSRVLSCLQQVAPEIITEEEEGMADTWENVMGPTR